jgi:ketosteroid isomerase-like protein
MTQQKQQRPGIKHLVQALIPLSLAALLVAACSRAEAPAAPVTNAQPSGAGAPPGVDPTAIFEQLVQAVNAGDVAAATALLSDDVVWEGPISCEEKACKGKTAAQKNIEALVAARTNWMRGGGQAQGNVVSLALMDLSQPGNGSLPGKLYACTMELQNGKIKSLQFRPATF